MAELLPIGKGEPAIAVDDVRFRYSASAPEVLHGVSLRVGNPQWLQRLLLRVAPDAVVLEPAAFAEQHLAAARAALKLYS